MVILSILRGFPLRTTDAFDHHAYRGTRYTSWYFDTIIFSVPAVVNFDDPTRLFRAIEGETSLLSGNSTYFKMRD